MSGDCNTTEYSEKTQLWDLKAYSNSTAIIDDSGTSLTYEQLLDASQELFSHINERSLMFILCRNAISSIIGYVSALNNHVVPLLLNADLEAGAISQLLTQYGPKYIWAPKKTKNWPEFEETYTDGNYSLLKSNESTKCMLHKDLALLLTTSGSTGSPKFVRQSYMNIKSNTESIIEYLRITSSDRAITTLPMNYTYGLSIINTHLYSGATLLVTDKTLMQKEFWTFLKEQKATTFGGVPYTYEMLHRLRFERMNLPSLRYITQAGGKLSVKLQKSFVDFSQKTGIEFVIMYGQCEATARMSYLPAENSADHLGSIGIAIPGGRFKLIADDGSEITACDTPGELVYIGPNVTLGYSFSKTDLCKGDERNGTLVTGDIAQFDKDGFYYIVGRKKRFLKVFGNRVNLDEIEQLVKDKCVGIDCAVSGTDDHVEVFVTNFDETEEIRKYLAHRTGLNLVAFSVHRIEQIPKNDSGKTLYEQLKSLG